MELKYQKGIGHNSNTRVSPPFYHSRFIHLKELKKHTLFFIDKYVKNKKGVNLIDLGCGEMPYKKFIEPKVEKYIGIDIPGNPDADYKVDPKTNRCTDLNGENADILLSIQVLEHVSDPDEYLKECYRLLKKNGYLLLSTHGHWKYHPDPIDYWRWTADGLHEIVAKNGFEVIETKGMMGLLPASLQLFQDSVLISLPLVRIWGSIFCAFMQFFIFLANKFVMHSRTLRAHANKDASTFFIIGEKK